MEHMWRETTDNALEGRGRGKDGNMYIPKELISASSTHLRYGNDKYLSKGSLLSKENDTTNGLNGRGWITTRARYYQPT